MPTAIHATDIQPMYTGRIWPYEKILPNRHLKDGDTVYLVESYGDLYAWGHVTKIELYKDVELGEELLKVSVSRPVIRAGLLSSEQIKQQPSLAILYAQPRTSLIELDTNQVKTFNQLLRSQGVEAPADPIEVSTPVVLESQSNQSSTVSESQPSNAIITESGDTIVTESGDAITTENGPPEFQPQPSNTLSQLSAVTIGLVNEGQDIPESLLVTVVLARLLMKTALINQNYEEDFQITFSSIDLLRRSKSGQLFITQRFAYPSPDC